MSFLDVYIAEKREDVDWAIGGEDKHGRILTDSLPDSDKLFHELMSSNGLGAMCSVKYFSGYVCVLFGRKGLVSYLKDFYAEEDNIPKLGLRYECYAKSSIKNPKMLFRDSKQEVSLDNLEDYLSKQEYYCLIGFEQ